MSAPSGGGVCQGFPMLSFARSSRPVSCVGVATTTTRERRTGGIEGSSSPGAFACKADHYTGIKDAGTLSKQAGPT